MNKIQPVTPLPWSVVPDPMYGAKVLGPMQDGAQKILSQAGDDCAYIAHATRQYPELVEALRYIGRMTTGRVRVSAKDLKLFVARTLRDLGEES